MYNVFVVLQTTPVLLGWPPCKVGTWSGSHEVSWEVEVCGRVIPLGLLTSFRVAPSCLPHLRIQQELLVFANLSISFQSTPYVADIIRTTRRASLQYIGTLPLASLGVNQSETDREVCEQPTTTVTECLRYGRHEGMTVKDARGPVNDIHLQTSAPWWHFPTTALYSYFVWLRLIPTLYPLRIEGVLCGWTNVH